MLYRFLIIPTSKELICVFLMISCVWTAQVANICLIFSGISYFVLDPIVVIIKCYIAWRSHAPTVVRLRRSILVTMNSKLYWRTIIYWLLEISRTIISSVSICFVFRKAVNDLILYFFACFLLPWVKAGNMWWMYELRNLI